MSGRPSLDALREIPSAITVVNKSAPVSIADASVFEAVPTASANFRTIALVVASALFMEQLDATVLVTALPTMARDLGASAPTMSTALTSYLLTLAIFIPA